MLHLNEDVKAFDKDIMNTIDDVLNGLVKTNSEDFVRYCTYQNSMGQTVEEIETEHMVFHNDQPIYFRAYRVFDNGVLRKSDSHLSVSLKP